MKVTRGTLRERADPLSCNKTGTPVYFKRQSFLFTFSYKLASDGQTYTWNENKTEQSKSHFKCAWIYANAYHFIRHTCRNSNTYTFACNKQPITKHYDSRSMNKSIDLFVQFERWSYAWLIYWNHIAHSIDMNDSWNFFFFLFAVVWLLLLLMCSFVYQRTCLQVMLHLCNAIFVLYLFWHVVSMSNIYLRLFSFDLKFEHV